MPIPASSPPDVYQRKVAGRGVGRLAEREVRVPYEVSMKRGHGHPRPVVLAAYRGIGDAIASHGTFDARTRETSRWR